MINKVRTRFAPSPTGYLHVGGLRTALYNFLFAKHHGGDFILRIEDTDQARLVDGAAEDILSSLKWAGIYPDESPETGGAFAPYVQSERLDVYRKHIHRLIDKGHCYPCFCTPERLQAVRETQQKNKDVIRYDRACLALDPETVKKNLDGGMPHVIRMKIPDREIITYRDVIRGEIRVPRKMIDDQILMKTDGYPTYHLASVVDDHSMAISHVIRGDEWLSSTPRHVLLYEFFNWEPPVFAHLPLLLNPDKSKLSKRQGDVAVSDYIRKGYLSEAFVNFISLLGWNTGDDNEIFSMKELIQCFSLERIGKSGSVFDIKKLNAINGQYMRQMPAEQFAQLAEKTLIRDKVICADTAARHREAFLKILDVLKCYANTLDELPKHARPFFIEGLPDWSKDEFKEILAAETTRTVLAAFQEQTKSLETIDEDCFQSTMKNIQKEKGIKGKFLYMPLRIALTGELHGPDLHLFTELLSKEERVNRINGLINHLLS